MSSPTFSFVSTKSFNSWDIAIISRFFDFIWRSANDYMIGPISCNRPE